MIFTPNKKVVDYNSRNRARMFGDELGLPPSLPLKHKLSPSKSIFLKSPSFEERFADLNAARTDISIQSPNVFVTPCRSASKSFTDEEMKTNHHYKFFAAVGSKPHPHKQNGGEDAFFVSENGVSIGIADGVGGWSDVGFDSGLYSREMMQLCKEIITTEAIPELVVKKAFEMAKSTGSTTCCLLSLQEGKRQIRAANLGDSTFILLRRILKTRAFSAEEKENNPNLLNSFYEPEDENKISVNEYNWRVVFRTTEQTHYFNCPKQIGTDCIDSPNDCDRYNVAFLPNDIVILGTDGLFDNLFLLEICNIANEIEKQMTLRASCYDFNFEEITPRAIKSVRGIVSPRKKAKGDESVFHSLNLKYDDEKFLNEFATRLTQEAFLASIDELRYTPFEKNAASNGLYYKGGKMDDISCVVAKIVEVSNFDMPDDIQHALNFDNIDN